MRVNQTNTHPVPQKEVSNQAGTQNSKATGRAQKSEKPGASAEVSKASSGKAASTAGASAEISARAKDFSAAKEVALQTPDVREDKVADLKRRIAEGKYQVESNAVADRLVDDHLRMSPRG